MSFKKIGTAGDLLRFGCSLRIECTHSATTLLTTQVVEATLQNALRP
jgi:hypothetical protein